LLVGNEQTNKSTTGIFEVKNNTRLFVNKREAKQIDKTPTRTNTFVNIGREEYFNLHSLNGQVRGL